MDILCFNVQEGNKLQADGFAKTVQCANSFDINQFQLNRTKYKQTNIRAIMIK